MASADGDQAALLSPKQLIASRPMQRIPQHPHKAKVLEVSPTARVKPAHQLTTPALVRLALTPRELPSLSSLAKDSGQEHPRTTHSTSALLSTGDANAPVTVPTKSPATSSVRDQDVLQDAEAYLWGQEGHRSSLEPKHTTTDKNSAIADESNNTGSLTALVRSLFDTASGTSETATVSSKEVVHVADLPSVCLCGVRCEAFVPDDIVTDAWAEAPTNVPVPSSLARCNSVYLLHDAAAPERRTYSGRLPKAFRPIVGPAAPYSVEREVQEKDEPVAVFSARTTDAGPPHQIDRNNNNGNGAVVILKPAVPLLIASEEVQPETTGPTNWVEYSATAARVAASRAAATATDMAASQVPGGALAVTAMSHGAAAVKAAGATEALTRAAQSTGGAVAARAATVSGAAAVAVPRAPMPAVGTKTETSRLTPPAARAAPEVAAATPAAEVVPPDEQPAVAPEVFVAPLRTTSTHAQAAVTAAASQRTQQLKLYVTQNFVPTLSDFIPGSNVLVERAAVKTKTWVTARVNATAAKAQRQPDKTAKAVCEDGVAAEARHAAAAASVVAVVPLHVEEEVRVGSPSPDTVVVHTTAQEWQRSSAAAPQTQIIEGQNCATDSKEGGAAAPAASTVPVVKQEEVAVATARIPPGGGIVPYASIRVLLCRCDGSSSNANNAVDAFEKFGRMPCKRKVQEVFGNLAYNFLPQTTRRSKQSPFREVLQLQAQQTWGGADLKREAAAAAAAIFASSLLSSEEVVDAVTGERTVITLTKDSAARLDVNTCPSVSKSCAEAPDNTLDKSWLKPHTELETQDEVVAFTNPATPKAALASPAHDLPSLTVNPLSPPAATGGVAAQLPYSSVPDAPTARVHHPRSSNDAHLPEKSGTVPGSAFADTASTTLSSTSAASPTKAAYEAYMSYGQQTVLYNTQYGVPPVHDWTRAFPCCCSAATCREGCCCMHCQLARQCNMLNYHRPTVLWPLCFLVCALDPCTCLLCSSTLACMNRAAARARYGIGGSFLGDCLFSFLCTRCVTAQVMDEMIAHDDYPGGLCMLPPMTAPKCSTMQ